LLKNLTAKTTKLPIQAIIQAEKYYQINKPTYESKRKEIPNCSSQQKRDKMFQARTQSKHHNLFIQKKS